MAEMIIRLSHDPDSGRRTIVVKLHSDSDATPLEHERQHRLLVERLLGAGIITPDETDAVRVERVAEPAAEADSGPPAAAERPDVTSGRPSRASEQ